MTGGDVRAQRSKGASDASRAGCDEMVRIVNGEIVRDGFVCFGGFGLIENPIDVWSSPNGVDSATSDMTLHFLRRPATERLVAEATIVREGRRLMVCDVMLYAAGEEEPVCHVTGSYALPSRRRA